MPKHSISRRDLPRFDRGPKPEKNMTGCTKIGFTLREANRVAGTRETLTGVKLYVVPCFEGCSLNDSVIYHITRQKPTGKNTRRLLRQPRNIPRPRKNKNGGQKKRHRRDVLRAQIADWENEGGAIR